MKKYIVGIDFGHGETAAWVVPVINVPGTDMKPEGESLKLRLSANFANDKLIDSVVYRLRSGVFTLERSPSSNIYTELKSPVRVLNQNPEKREAYKAYIQLVIERLLIANSLLGKEDGEWNFHLCIACPTKWGEKDKNDYIHFFNEALSEKGLSVLWVINESDAAFFTHRPKDDPNQCVLVVDYGSSTIDYTVIQNGKKVSDDSWSNSQLGACCIEKYFLSEYKNTAYDEYQSAFTNTERILKETDNAHMSVESRLLYDARKQKEESFKNNTYPMCYLDFDFGRYTGWMGKPNPFKPYSFDFYGNLETITEKYRKVVLADFEKLRTRIDGLSDDNDEGRIRIVLSGGACNMQWVKRMLQTVFTNADVVEDREPSYVVAKGIALYAQAQFNALHELRKAIAQINFEDIYKKADMETTAESISQMSYKVKDSIRKLSNPNAGDIHLEFRNFLYGLDGKDESYSSIFRQMMNTRISDEVHEKLSRIVRNLFYKEISRDEIDISLDIDVYLWPQEPFMLGGKYSSLIGRWIEQAAVACSIASDWGPNSFNWTKGRNSTKCEKLANGTISRMVDYFKYDSDSINYNPTNMETTVNKLRNSVLDLSEELFYKLQLFKTTFV